MNETIEVAQVIKAIESACTRLPDKIAATAVNFSKERFRAQNWVDGNTEPWRPRKKSSRWGKTKRNNGRKLLVDTGRLRRSIRKIYADSEVVIIGTDVEYAQVHNDGFSGTVIQDVKAHKRNRYGKKKEGKGIYSVKTRRERTRTVKTIESTGMVKAHTRTIHQNIPRRQFIGQSAILSQQIERIVVAEFTRALKQ